MSTPSHDLDAEQATLGAMLLSPDIADQILGTLREADFYRPAHGLVFAAIRAVADTGERPDAITVAARMQHDRTLERAGGHGYLHSLLAACPIAASGTQYARIVADHALRRAVDQAGQTIRQIAAESDPADLPVLADETLIAALAPVRREGAVPIADIIPDVLDQAEHPRDHLGLDSGLPDLDALTGGFRAGQLVLIGARPGIGKSVLLLQVCARAAVRDQAPALLVSLEMSRRECVQRLVAAKAGIPLTSLIRGFSELDSADRQRVHSAAETLAAAPLEIEDSPGAGLAGIRGDLRAMRRAGRPAAILGLDYLQLMTSAKRAENRQQEISDLSRSLKLLARDFSLPVLAASQLNRGPEARVDKQPLLADLRESGSLEQDADVVILLHRDDAYDRGSARAGQIDLIVAKNRHGQAGRTIPCHFQGQYARIMPLARLAPSRPGESRFPLAGTASTWFLAARA